MAGDTRALDIQVLQESSADLRHVLFSPRGMDSASHNSTVSGYDSLFPTKLWSNAS